MNLKYYLLLKILFLFSFYIILYIFKFNLVFLILDFQITYIKNKIFINFKSGYIIFLGEEHNRLLNPFS